MSRLFFSLCFAAFLWGCNTPPENLSAYYFPFDALKEGKVYVFKTIAEGPAKKDYWYYRSMVDAEGKPHLKAIALNSQGLPQQFLDYRWDAAEIRLVSMYIVERSPSGKAAIIPVQIRQPYVFNLAMRDTAKSLYAELVWNNPFDSLEYTLQKVRSFKGFDRMEIMGKKRPVLKYEIATEFKTFTPKDGETDSAWPEQETYASGLGLGQYRMTPDPDYPLELKLYKIYEKEAYEKQYHIHLDSLKPDLIGIQRR